MELSIKGSGRFVLRNNEVTSADNAFTVTEKTPLRLTIQGKAHDIPMAYNTGSYSTVVSGAGVFNNFIGSGEGASNYNFTAGNMVNSVQGNGNIVDNLGGLRAAPVYKKARFEAAEMKEQMWKGKKYLIPRGSKLCADDVDEEVPAPASREPCSVSFEGEISRVTLSGSVVLDIQQEISKRATLRLCDASALKIAAPPLEFNKLVVTASGACAVDLTERTAAQVTVVVNGTSSVKGLKVIESANLNSISVHRTKGASFDKHTSGMGTITVVTL